MTETRWPLFSAGRARSRHLLPDLVLASLTILTNVGFASALRPARLDVGRWGHAWPRWLQATAGVVVLDFFAWAAHLLLHKSAWGWRVRRVHHSDPAVDVTTALRQHPGETVWSTWDRLFGTFTSQTQFAGLRYGVDGFDGSVSQSLGGLLRMPTAR